MWPIADLAVAELSQLQSIEWEVATLWIAGQHSYPLAYACFPRCQDGGPPCFALLLIESIEITLVFDRVGERLPRSVELGEGVAQRRGEVEMPQDLMDHGLCALVVGIVHCPGDESHVVSGMVTKRAWYAVGAVPAASAVVPAVANRNCPGGGQQLEVASNELACPPQDQERAECFEQRLLFFNVIANSLFYLLPYLQQVVSVQKLNCSLPECLIIVLGCLLGLLLPLGSCFSLLGEFDLLVLLCVLEDLPPVLINEVHALLFLRAQQPQLLHLVEVRLRGFSVLYYFFNFFVDSVISFHNVPEFLMEKSEHQVEGLFSFTQLEELQLPVQDLVLQGHCYVGAEAVACCFVLRRGGAGGLLLVLLRLGGSALALAVLDAQ